MQEKSIIILGAGRIGLLIALDLLRDASHKICLVDGNQKALEAAQEKRNELQIENNLTCIQADLSNAESIQKTVKDYDLVVGALSSSLGRMALEAVIRAKKDYCDISFMPEDALELDSLAKEMNVTAIVDCGLAPGMSNLFAGLAEQELDPCEELSIYVGGLPKERTWPFEYKAGFSPYDVIEEYTRIARMVEHGKEVQYPALSGSERLEFSQVGSLEAFNTDGLRSLMQTLQVPNMKEKTLRYPGHRELMESFRHLGLFSHEAVQTASGMVKPIDLMSALLFPKWTFEEGEEDLTVMRVQARGLKNNKPTRIQWELYDEYDKELKLSSMARTTAFPCTILVRLVAKAAIEQSGVIPLERLAPNSELVEHILGELEQRGVCYSKTESAAFE